MRKATGWRGGDEANPAARTFDLDRFAGRNNPVQGLEEFGAEVSGGQTHRVRSVREGLSGNVYMLIKDAYILKERAVSRCPCSHQTP